MSLVAAIVAGGCGNTFYSSNEAAQRTLFVVECEGEIPGRVASDIVILDWHGGVTPLYPDDSFEPLDLSAFETAEGRTLGDDAELFKERVRQQITRVYCESTAPGIRVLHAEDGDDLDGTIVYFTQILSPLGGFEIGEAEYDPCNEQHDNTAVIFGEQIRQLGAAYTFDEWVLVFANVTAHEIGHTLGYGHVDRDDWLETGRSLFVELMLDRHTMSELRREQRFIADQTNCPDDSSVARRRNESPTIICEIGTDAGNR